MRPTIVRRAWARTRRGDLAGPVSCSDNFPTASDYFLGISNDGNVAGGVESAVLGGAENRACDPNSGVVAGSGNIVGNNDNADYSMIGAGEQNAVTGLNAFVGAGETNYATDNDSMVGAGSFNGAEGADSFVGAGGGEFEDQSGNTVPGGNNVAGAADSFVGGGDLNQISGSGDGSFIGAGGFTYAATGAGTPGNRIFSFDSFIGAGDTNSVSGNNAFVGAGTSNTASAASFVAGGTANVVSGEYGSVIGGYGNHASGSYAVIAGGNGNTAAGTLSLAGGYHADAVHSGSFVWSDYSSGSALVKDTAANQFVARASGGVSFYSNEAATAGVRLGPGSGTWASLSDRNAKTDIEPLDDDSILAKVAALPVSAWRYKTENGVRHLGPMAQDFYASFGVGEDNRHITSIDEDGVALAAIKALDATLAGKSVQIAVLHRRADAMQSRLSKLESENAVFRTELSALVARVGAGAGRRP